MTQLEEEFELIEAQRDIRKAYMKAAEVTVKSAEASFDLISRPGVNIAQTELIKARFDLEAAKAQLEIRAAELKEVEVKVKYAKKRLDELKTATARPVAPAPRVDPKPVDPPPPR